MFQAVPLTSTLRVDIYLIIECNEVRCHVNHLLLKLFTSEAWELNIVEGPIELDVFTGRDLAAGSFDDIVGEKVDGYGEQRENVSQARMKEGGTQVCRGSL